MKNYKTNMYWYVIINYYYYAVLLDYTSMLRVTKIKLYLLLKEEKAR